MINATNKKKWTRRDLNPRPPALLDEDQKSQELLVRGHAKQALYR